MKKQMAAFVMALGLLSGCTLAGQNNTTENTSETQGSIEQSSDRTPEVTALADYVEKGKTISDAVEEDGFQGAVVPVLVGDLYAAANGSGVPQTDAMYDRVKALTGDGKTVWVFYRKKKITCLSETGNILLQRTGGSVSVLDEKYLAWKAADGTSEIFSMDGTLLTEFSGKPKSCAGGVLVSCSKKTWYLTDTDTWVTKKISGVQRITPFYAGNAVVQITKKSWGLIDKKGAIMKLRNIRWMDQIRSNYILAKDKSGAYGVLTTAGQEVVSFLYEKAQACSEDTPIYQLWTADGKCTVRNVKTNQSVRLPNSFEGESLTAWPDNYFSFTQSDGTIILFDDLGTIKLTVGTKLTLHSQDILAACDGNTVAFVDLTRGTMTKKQKGIYVKNRGISAGQTHYVTIQDPQTGLQGIWNIEGEEVLPLEYEWIRASGSGLFSVKQDSGYGLVDDKGTWTVALSEE